MNKAQSLISRARALGTRFEVAGEKLVLQAPSPLPPELIEDLRRYKDQVLDYLREDPRLLTEGYRYECPGSDRPGDGELAEIERRIHSEGYVLLWSTVLEDLVAFYKDEGHRKKIPPGFVAYSETELIEMFRGCDLDLAGLRLVHEAKKHGGTVISSEDNPNGKQNPPKDSLNAADGSGPQRPGGPEEDSEC